MAEEGRQNSKSDMPARSALMAWLLVVVLGIVLISVVLWPTELPQTVLSDDPATPPSTDAPDRTVNVNPGLPTVDITLVGESYRMEVAASRNSRAIGLSKRDNIPAGTGMVFVYPAARPRTLWMRDCLVDMDAVFVDDHGRIAVMHQMVTEPPQQRGETRAAYQQRLRVYPCPVPVRFILELPAGTIERLELQVGQTISLPAEQLRGMVIN